MQAQTSQTNGANKPTLLSLFAKHGDTTQRIASASTTANLRAHVYAQLRADCEGDPQRLSDLDNALRHPLANADITTAVLLMRAHQAAVAGGDMVITPPAFDLAYNIAINRISAVIRRMCTTCDSDTVYDIASSILYLLRDEHDCSATPTVPVSQIISSRRLYDATRIESFCRRRLADERAPNTSASSCCAQFLSIDDNDTDREYHPVLAEVDAQAAYSWEDEYNDMYSRLLDKMQESHADAGDVLHAIIAHAPELNYLEYTQLLRTYERTLYYSALRLPRTEIARRELTVRDAGALDKAIQAGDNCDALVTAIVTRSANRTHSLNRVDRAKFLSAFTAFCDVTCNADMLGAYAVWVLREGLCNA